MPISAKDCHTLTSYFEKVYKDKYDKAPNVNRYAARWGFDSVLKSMNMKDARALLDYYLTTSSTRKHDLEWFFYNYHKLIESMQRATEDAAHRRKLMEESKSRAEKWRQSGRQGIAND